MLAMKQTIGILIKDQRGQIYLKVALLDISTSLGYLCACYQPASPTFLSILSLLS